MGKKPPELTVVADPVALAQAAANRLAGRLAAARDRFAVCLAGGSSPEALYRLLSTEPFRSKIPWERTHWFWGDDRFVRQRDPRSNSGAARRLFLDRSPAPRENIHAIPTDAGSVDEAAGRYEALLRGFYGADRLDDSRPLFDVVLMGLGDDGHTASLFPGQAELAESERWVVGVAEAGLAPFVPRVTLTFPALASTRDMLFLVSGRGKRGVMTRLLAGADLPAARAYAHGDRVWLVDRAAAPERRDVA
ncbi:MAG TPA: 6-phosphogluconolactonase [Xanthobacteraceae bacterium]|nr:6-phosphogluconolactonase [Xanthobacteraceae bacterium]